MKNYIWKYKTPEGFDDLVMCGDGEALTGLWFEGSRDDWRNTRECERCETPVFRDTCRWLDEYFAGRDPGFTPKFRATASSARTAASPVTAAGWETRSRSSRAKESMSLADFALEVGGKQD